MDWNTAISTAIGTTGGTLLTVFAAWLIYRSERNDVRKRNKSQRIYDLIQDMTESIHDLQSNIYHLQTVSYLVRNHSDKDNYLKEYNQFIYNRKIVANLTKRLENKSVTLENLSGFGSHYEVTDYVSLVTKFTSHDLNWNNYDSEVVKKNVKELEKMSIRLLNEIQKLIIEDSSKD